MMLTIVFEINKSRLIESFFTELKKIEKIVSFQAG